MFPIRSIFIRSIVDSHKLKHTRQFKICFDDTNRLNTRVHSLLIENLKLCFEISYFGGFNFYR